MKTGLRLGKEFFWLGKPQTVAMHSLNITSQWLKRLQGIRLEAFNWN